jgi:general secretion pathway protein D
MQVFQEVSSISGGSVDGLITNKRSIESNVLVEDGSIVVLGGLVQDDYGASVEKVPFLGDIPVLGNLFKVDTRKRKKTNLMIFLRPVVMRDAVTTENFSLNRYDEIRGNLIDAQPRKTWFTNINESPTLNPTQAVLGEGVSKNNAPLLLQNETRPFTKIPPMIPQLDQTNSTNTDQSMDEERRRR